MSQGDSNRLAALGDEVSIFGYLSNPRRLTGIMIAFKSKFICKKMQKSVALGHYMPS